MKERDALDLTVLIRRFDAETASLSKPGRELPDDVS